MVEDADDWPDEPPAVSPSVIPPAVPVNASAPPPAPPPASAKKPSAPPPPPEKPSEATERPTIEGIALEDVDAFVDLSPEMHQRLIELARVEELGADEEVSSFGAALLLLGEAVVCATIVDAPAYRASAGTLVPSRGSMSEAITIRVVADAKGAKVAVWEQAMVDEALKTCPWVLEDLIARADHIQALAGATMGPLGDLDEESRNLLLHRLKVRVLKPAEVIATAGQPTAGVVVVGAGTLDILVGAEPPARSLRPGDMLFPRAVLEGQPAPCTARAGASGALILTGEGKIAQQLFASAPPLVSLLSGDD